MSKTNNGDEYSVDRSGWPSGPWDNEPDRLEWTTKAGLPGLIVRNGMGALCGYAGVSEHHPLYKVDYADVDDQHVIDVHGGLTYSDHCRDDICHTPKPDESDRVWWLGFDCAHSFDISPSRPRTHGLDFAARLAWSVSAALEADNAIGLAYRDIGYVKEEVEKLAKQLVKIKVAR